MAESKRDREYRKRIAHEQRVQERANREQSPSGFFNYGKADEVNAAYYFASIAKHQEIIEAIHKKELFYRKVGIPTDGKGNPLYVIDNKEEKDTSQNRELYHWPFNMGSVIFDSAAFENLQKQEESTHIFKQPKSMTKLHHSIMHLLLPICLETTKKMRDKYEPAVSEESKSLFDIQKEKVTKLSKYLSVNLQLMKDKSGLSDQHIRPIMQLCITSIAFATDQPYLLEALRGIEEKKDTQDIYDPLTIIVRKESDGLSVPINTPFLVIHGVNKHALAENGRIFQQIFNNHGKQVTRVATDEEVESCLSNLTPAQIRYIMSNDLFASALAPLFEEGDELVVEKSDETSEG